MSNLRASRARTRSNWPYFIIDANQTLAFLWHTKGIMLIEIWERLRGYDKWTKTDATILSSELVEPQAGLPRSERSGKRGSALQWRSTCVISWTDKSGSAHNATYTVSDSSRLFQCYDGQTVSIRYNPVNADEYYLRALFRDKAFMATFWCVYFAVCLGSPIIHLVGWLIRHLR
jgi:hypothetical protein